LVPEDAANKNTADGRPATIACAHDRLARMVCCDRQEIDRVEARTIAAHFASEQKKQLSAAITEVVSRDADALGTAIIAGSGELLAGTILAEHPHARGATTVRLAEFLSVAMAEAACAYAVAVLATEV
jgi:hypothetical protein